MAASASLTVMIVNDHPIMRDGLRLVVESEPDMRVVCQVTGPAEAFDKLRSCNPHVVLIDLQGFESPGSVTMRAIRRIAPSIPIVVLATFADEATCLLGLSLEHTVCLPKTATPDEVLAALRGSHIHSNE